MTVKNIIKKAQKLSECFKYKKFDDGAERVIIESDDKTLQEECINLTFKVSQETNLSTDSAYRFTSESLNRIAESGAKSMEDLTDLAYNLEPDIYTYDLTAWLNENVNHIHYLDEAVSGGVDSGWQALALAQQFAKEEVQSLVLDLIQ